MLFDDPKVHKFVSKLLAGPTPFRLKGRDYDDGVDCWGLCVLAYRDVLGIDLPSYDDSYTNVQPGAALAAAVAHGHKELAWCEVPSPMSLDVVLLRLAGVPVHCGLVVGESLMLHVEGGIETCIERWNGPVWRHRLAGFWRHPKRGLS